MEFRGFCYATTILSASKFDIVIELRVNNKLSPRTKINRPTIAVGIQKRLNLILRNSGNSRVISAKKEFVLFEPNFIFSRNF